MLLYPSDCYPAGPAGPCAAGSPVGSDDYLQVLDHVDPAGQHADVQDTVESLEHSVLDYILDGRHMEGITCPELLEYTLKLLDTTLDGGLIEKISDWELAAHPVPDATLDGRPMDGTTTLEHSVLVESLDSRPMEGMLSPEPWEQQMLNTLLVARPMEGYTEMNPAERSAPASQLDYGHSNLRKFSESVLNTLLVARPTEGSTETTPPERSALASQLDYGHLNLEPLARPMLDVALYRRPTEGLAVPLPVESLGLAMTPTSAPMEVSRPLEQSVLDIKMGIDK